MIWKQKKEPAIFISHAWEDKKVAFEIEKLLKARGLKVWVDHTEIHGGHVFPARVSKAIEACSVLILIWSKDAEKSHWVQREWATAVNLNKNIIPCIVDTTPVPAILTSSAYVDFRQPGKGKVALYKALEIETPFEPNPGAGNQKRSYRSVIVLGLVIVGLSLSIISIEMVRSRGTITELDIFATDVGFSLPPEVGKGEFISLLSSGIWAKSISVSNFKPIELTIDSFMVSFNDLIFENPLTITPDPIDGRITFSSEIAGISLQEIAYDSAGRVTLRYDDSILIFEIDGSSSEPYLLLSLGENLNISTRGCRITDGRNHDLTSLFASPVPIKLAEFASSVKVRGMNGNLKSINKGLDYDPAESLQFFYDQPIQNMEFFKTVSVGSNPIKRSSIDSLVVKKSQTKVIPYKSRSEGDLEIMAEPNHFFVYELSMHEEFLRVNGVAKLNSLRIGRPETAEEVISSLKLLTILYWSVIIAVLVSIAAFVTLLRKMTKTT